MNQYTDLLTFLAENIKISYKPVSSRPKVLNYLGEKIFYNEEKSSNYYSHYETEEYVLVSFRGVNNLTSLIEGISKKLLPSLETDVVKNICKKYQELINEERDVYTVSHSLGSYGVVRCSLLFNKTFKSFMFAPYVPSDEGNIFNEYMKRNYKKMFYTNDLVSNKLIRTKTKLYNTMIFKNNNFLFIKNHKIDIFRRPPFIMNNELLKFIN